MRSILLALLCMPICSFCQEYRYKRTEFEITYKKRPNGKYSRFRKTKERHQYCVYDKRCNEVEIGEYGLEYCISDRSQERKEKNDSEINFVLYRVCDYSRLRSLTYFLYDTVGRKTQEMYVQFLPYGESWDTTITTFQYNAKNQLEEKNIMYLGDGTENHTRKIRYRYSATGAVLDIVDENERSLLDKDIVEKYDSAGRLIERRSMHNGKQTERIVYKNDMCYSSITTYGADDELTTIQETFGCGRPEAEYLTEVGRLSRGFREYKYDRRGKLTSVRYYWEDSNTGKRVLRWMNKYKYQFY